MIQPVRVHNELVDPHFALWPGVLLEISDGRLKGFRLASPVVEQKPLGGLVWVSGVKRGDSLKGIVTVAPPLPYMGPGEPFEQ